MKKLTSFLLTIAVSASPMFAIQKNITDCYIIKCNKNLIIFDVVYVGKKELPEEQELRLSDAFYTKDSSKLELVVTVKNCSSSKLLPVVKKCSILKQYCQFIEIIEHNYNKLFPKKSFKKAIEIAMEQGILKDYLDRKSREVINMLCAKYDYKMDIAVKQEEAREEGIAIGMQEGDYAGFIMINDISEQWTVIKNEMSKIEQ